MSGSTSFKSRKTPGVYVTEFAAFPPAVVGVATAIPVFIGYTQTAQDPTSNAPLYNKPVAIGSMADYYAYFGYGFDAQYVVDVLNYGSVEAMGTVVSGNFTILAGGSETGTVVAQFANGTSVGVPPKVLPFDFQAPSYIKNTSDDKTAPALQQVPGQQYAVTSGSRASNGGAIVPQFNLFAAMQLFFANGGGTCFVVSVANYQGKQDTVPSPIAAPLAGTVAGAAQVDAKLLLAGLAAANDIDSATMIVVPDACLLTMKTGSTYTDYQKVATAMIEQAASLQSRVAILDLPGALDPSAWSRDGLLQQQADFETSIAPAQPYFSYAAAYAPAVETSVLATGDVDYTNLLGTPESVLVANNLLTTQALNTYAPGWNKNPGTVTTTPQFDKVAMNIGAAFPVADDLISKDGITSTATNLQVGTITLTGAVTPTSTALVISKPMPAPATAGAITSTANFLRNATPLLGQMEQILLSRLNVAPPSGIMAGIWTRSDSLHGVQNAPANLSLNEVVAPKVELNDADQAGFNVPISGEAIDILRTLRNRGVVVWGARTLDGNSLDYRYIQVRRTLIYLEQSIKNALKQFVFAANDASTWATVTATVSNFLTQFWQAGGLMGSKASEAFTVACGVPTTMTGQDVLNGYMVVNVTVQMIHPAEFIELTFTQTMSS